MRAWERPPEDRTLSKGVFIVFGEVAGDGPCQKCLGVDETLRDVVGGWHLEFSFSKHIDPCDPETRLPEGLGRGHERWRW